MQGTLYELLNHIQPGYDAFHPGIEWVIKANPDGTFRLIDKVNSRFYPCGRRFEILLFFGANWCQDAQWQLVLPVS